MSPTQLKVDTHVLKDAANSLKTISNEFGDAGNKAKSVADLIGTSGSANDLHNAIRDFADKWDRGRAKIKEGIDALSTAVQEVAKNIEDTDKSLADSLNDSTSTNSTASNPSSSSDSSSSNSSGGTSQSQSGGSPSPSGSSTSGDYRNVGDAQQAYDQNHSELTQVQNQRAELQAEIARSTVVEGTGVAAVVGAGAAVVSRVALIAKDTGLAAQEAVLNQKEAELAKDVKREGAFSSWKSTIPNIGSDFYHPAGRGAVIEVGDGNYAQCVDVAKSYAKSLFGVDSLSEAFPALGGKFNGDTAFANASDAYFQKLPASATPQPGDIISFGGASENGHVVVVDHVDPNGTIHTIEQDGLYTHGYGPYYGTYGPDKIAWGNHCLGILRPNPDKII